jgi:hypothetical protein
MTTWAGIDAPWLAVADTAKLGRMLDDVLKLDPVAIISGHLPATAGATMRRVVGNLLGAVSEERFALPSREAVEALFAEPVAS